MICVNMCTSFRINLLSFFAGFGEIVKTELKRDKITLNSLGYGFVQFKTRDAAIAAKKARHKTFLGTRAIRIGWAQKNTNLFIGDLDPLITSEQLRECFRRFGPLHEEETFVKRKHYGFVRFRYRADAERAKRELEGRCLGSKPLRIGWGDANSQRHVVFVQFSALGREISEEELKNRFSHFGTVLSVSIPRSLYGEQRGFAFVRFNDSDEGEENAKQAIEKLNKTSLEGIQIRCTFGQRPLSSKRWVGRNPTFFYQPSMMLPPAVWQYGPPHHPVPRTHGPVIFQPYSPAAVSQGYAIPPYGVYPAFEGDLQMYPHLSPHLSPVFPTGDAYSHATPPIVRPPATHAPPFVPEE